jgi:hydroxymethylpyrimidine pyrophosphatase-like HAD family hydrolase
MLNKIIAFDLDDTLCSRPKNLEHLGPEKYNYCTPIQPTIDVLNKLYDQGNIIYIYTARGMGQFDGNVQKTYWGVCRPFGKHRQNSRWYQ